MSDLAELQNKILYHLSGSGEAQVSMDSLQAKLNERGDRVSSAIRGLLESSRITLHQTSGGSAEGAGPPRMYVSLAHGDMSESVSLVYEAIRAAGTSGVDQQHLAARLRLPKSDIVKALRTLTQAQKIQEQRSFTNRAKRVYLLFHLQPSAQVTGGTLYRGEDLDIPLVDELRRRIVSFLSQHRSLGLRQIEQFVERQTAEGGGGGVSSSASASFPQQTGQGERYVMDGDNHDSNNSNISSHVLPGGQAAKSEYDFDDMEAFGLEQGDSVTVKREVDVRREEGEEDGLPPGSPIAFIHSSGGTSLANSQMGAATTAAERSFPGGYGNSHTSANPRGFSGRSAAAVDSAGLPQPVSLAAKRIQPKDVRALMQTLVLDGVVDELLPSGGSTASAGTSLSFYAPSSSGGEADRQAPRYQLSTGGNVMRHFTAASRSLHTARRSSSNNHADSRRPDGLKRPRDSEEERRATLASLQAAMAQESLWGPAEISQPTAFSENRQHHDRHRSGNAAIDSWVYMPAVGFPCLGCPQLASCSAVGKGVMNQRECAYLAEWLR